MRNKSLSDHFDAARFFNPTLPKDFAPSRRSTFKMICEPHSRWPAWVENKGCPIKMVTGRSMSVTIPNINRKLVYECTIVSRQPYRQFVASGSSAVGVSSFQRKRNQQRYTHTLEKEHCGQVKHRHPGHTVEHRTILRSATPQNGNFLGNRGRISAEMGILVRILESRRPVGEQKSRIAGFFAYSARQKTNSGLTGWGAWIRTRGWRNQNPLPYHLATPQYHSSAFRIAAASNHINEPRTKMWRLSYILPWPRPSWRRVLGFITLSEICTFQTSATSCA